MVRHQNRTGPAARRPRVRGPPRRPLSVVGARYFARAASTGRRSFTGASLPQRGEGCRWRAFDSAVDLLGRDVAVGKPAPQGLRRDVDQFDLGCLADDLVGHRLPLFDAGDLRDDVVEASRCCTLTVEITEMPASSSSSTSIQRFGSCCPGCWCGPVRRRGRPEAAGPVRPVRRVRGNGRRGSRCSAAG